MLYELLCNGQHPYPGAEPLVDEEIIDPKSVRPDLNNELAEFLRKACASNRAKRFDNAVEMEAELRRIRTDIGSASLLEPLPASRCSTEPLPRRCPPMFAFGFPTSNGARPTDHRLSLEVDR